MFSDFLRSVENAGVRVAMDSPSKKISDQLDDIVSRYADFDSDEDCYFVEMSKIDKDELEKLAAYLIESGNKNTEFFYENEAFYQLPLFFSKSLLGATQEEKANFFDEAHQAIVDYFWETMERMINDRVADYDPLDGHYDESDY